MSSRDRKRDEARQAPCAAAVAGRLRSLSTAILALSASALLLAQSDDGLWDEGPIWSDEPYWSEETDLPAQSAEPEAPASDETFDSEAALGELRRLLASEEENLEQQEKAWPSRRQDQLQELAPPPAVQRLQVEHARILRQRAGVLQEIDAAAARDPAFLISALSEAQDAALASELLPILDRRGRSATDALAALKSLAGRLDPCPPALLRSLEDFPSEDAPFFLLELGSLKKSARWLEAAGHSGVPAVIEQIMQHAEGEDNALAEASLRALERLSPPPPDRRDEALARFVLWRLERAHSDELRAVLITYLGLFRDAQHAPVLESIYASSQDLRVRLAVIAALGNIGEAAGPLLLTRMRESRDSLVIQRACIHSLGAARYRPAGRWLIRLFDHPLLRRDALRALQRISGESFADSRAPWVRWWRAQPESEGDEKDPDEA